MGPFLFFPHFRLYIDTCGFKKSSVLWHFVCYLRHRAAIPPVALFMHTEFVIESRPVSAYAIVSGALIVTKRVC
jgi:hypothetical protein